MHSQHWRILQDLPVQSFPMILMLHLGRWLVLLACWLRAVNLHRTSFQSLRPYARRAKRASEIIGVVRRALGGRPGQRA
jgi:hypothetical protein